MQNENSGTSRNRLVRIAHRLGAGNSVVFSVIVVSALFVTAARTLAPFEVGKDQSTQLEAAQRLSAGSGLTTTNDVLPRSFDIIEEPPPEYLTWWPPGFSLIVAAFLSLGFSLLVSLKIIYVTVTLIGWIGWAILVSHFLSRPWSDGKRNYHLHVVIAALLPIFTTMSWGGSDIFLWAGIPFILFCLFWKGTKESSDVFAAIAGLLLGSLFAIRYASIFLMLAAPLILMQVNGFDLKPAFKKTVIFLASSLLVILPTVIFVKVHSRPAPALTAPVYPTSLNNTSSTAFQEHEVLYGLPMTANLIFGVPMSDLLIFKLRYRPLIYVLGVVCLLVLLAVPLILIKSHQRDGKKFQNDMALSLSFLPLALIAFLISVVLLTDTGLMMNIRRYYLPVALCGVLIFYQIVSERTSARAVKTAAGAIVLGYLIYLCGIMPALAFVPERNGYVVKTLLDFMPPNHSRYPSTSQKLTYPSARMFSLKESSKQEVKQLFKANPQALFFVEEYGHFVYDGFIDGGPRPGKDLRVFPREWYWQQAYTSRPVKVFWVVNQDTELNFLSRTSQHVLVSDPIEKTKIIGAEFPAGYRFGQVVTGSATPEKPSRLADAERE
jgi:hypothetical protein